MVKCYLTDGAGEMVPCLDLRPVPSTHNRWLRIASLTLAVGTRAFCGFQWHCPQVHNPHTGTHIHNFK